MINSFNYSLFPSDQLFTFAKRSLLILEPLMQSVPALAPFINRAVNGKANFQAALERELKNPMTPLVVAADGDCDSSFMAFRCYIEAASYRKIDGWKEAASKIMEVIRRHGWSANRLGYKVQIAAETTIISDLKNKCTAEMDTVLATGWFNEFEAAELAFEAVLHQSLATMPTGEPTVLVTRPALEDALRKLLSMVSLLNSGEPVAELTAVEINLNTLITTSLASIKAADTRAENAKKEEEETKPAQ